MKQTMLTVRKNTARQFTPIRTARKETQRNSLMNIGRRVDYAVRALSYLAAQPLGRIVSRTEIERKQNIPSHYLSKIMKELVLKKIVVSHIGSKGGFTLAKAAQKISLKDVYEGVEGPLSLIRCLQFGEAYCPYCSVCSQISVWEKAQDLLATYLAGVSIADIADREGLTVRLRGVRS